MYITTISSQRQLTLPRALLDQLNLQKKSKVQLELTGDQLVIKPVTTDITSLAGSLLDLIPSSKRGVPLNKVRSQAQSMAARELAK